ncbi:hypothetical protein BDR26DRAFT_858042 [Obelidium mucronatum]|nr:hypothetical protein BDR26DRAFT_858042 [Obelidium mucronatum]
MEKAKNGDPGALAVLPLRCLWFQGKPSSNRDRVYRVGVSATGVGLGLSTVSVLAYHQSPEKVLRFFSVSQRWIGWLGLGLVLTPLVLGVSMLSLGFFVDVGCVGYDCCVSGWNNGDAKKKGATSTTTTTTKSVSLDVCCWPLVSLTSNSTFA